LPFGNNFLQHNLCPETISSTGIACTKAMAMLDCRRHLGKSPNKFNHTFIVIYGDLE